MGLINFNETKVLMLAPTGKAAYNIKGNTIHSALAIPACQSLKNYKSLDSSRLNTLRSQIGRLKLIFIDEISMVGNTMFTVQIYNRLKDIKGSSLPFGGVSIVAIGDFSNFFSGPKSLRDFRETGPLIQTSGYDLLNTVLYLRSKNASQK